MKLFFTRDDSFYKICKTVEKLPKNKKISILMDAQNSFFGNPRWGKQVKNILDEKHITYIFVCKSEKTRRYCDEVGLVYTYDQPNHFLRGIKLVYMFFFQAQKFHLSLFNKKSTLSYVFFIGEVLIIGLIAYFLYQFVLPSATVYVKPSYTVEDIIYNFRYYPAWSGETVEDSSFISIPYTTGEVHYTYTLKTNTQNISFLQKPSVGKAKLLNTSYQSFSLRPGTKLVTKDGILFTMPAAVEVPPGTRRGPSEIEVSVVAMDKDEDGNVIGLRGNIPVGTELLIRNLPQSYKSKLAYAVATDNFSGGETRKSGSLTSGDLENIRERMGQYVRLNKKQIVQDEFMKRSDQYPLMFQGLIDVRVDKVSFSAKPGDNTSDVEGKLDATYIVRYFTWNSLQKALKFYLNQRPSQTLDIISMQKNSLTFFPDQNKPITGDNLLVMPTKMSVIRGYDFDKDYN
ncbi:hypothetical protein KBC03_04540, partial [Patescibacteria group bacterium]|nr:hypothetical protein [Patescibacteria group bacterium]